MQKIALLFPGQGSQQVGMGQDFYEHTEVGREIFDRFEDIIKRDLSGICFSGPERDLTSTINAQPAIAAVSAIAYSLFKERSAIAPAFVAGHSLGECSSLYAADAISLEDLILLVDTRSRLMNAAKKGRMSAIINLREDQLQKVLQYASRFGTVVIANYNSPTQAVISGDEAAVNSASTAAKRAGAIVLPVAVSRAFHSPLMNDLVKPFEAFLDQIRFTNARIPVVTNVDAAPTVSGQELKKKLVMQLNSPILWRQSIELMVQEGVDTFVEIGPQQVLSNMLRRWLPRLNVYNVYDLPSLDSFLTSLKQ